MTGVLGAAETTVQLADVTLGGQAVYVGAESPPAEQGLILPKRVLEQCEADAQRVDLLEPALRGCQRDLDAGAGALDEARRIQAELDRQRRELERRLADLEAKEAARWSPWVWWGIGIASAAGAALIVALAIN